MTSPPSPGYGAARTSTAASITAKGEEERSWPSEVEEAAFLSGVREEVPVAPFPAVEAAAPTAPSEALPPVEELAERIPAEVRATLDELFRARFTRVMRAKPKV